MMHMTLQWRRKFEMMAYQDRRLLRQTKRTPPVSVILSNWNVVLTWRFGKWEPDEMVYKNIGLWDGSYYSISRQYAAIAWTSL